MMRNAVVSRHAKHETATPMNNPHIMPTENAYLITLPSSALTENRPFTNSGDTVATSDPNTPPNAEDSKDPSKTRKK